MERKRLDEIDFLRALGIIGVIVIHVLTYSLTNPFYRFIWNYAQFVVIIFVFCSGYVLATIYKDRLKAPVEILKWYKKRFIRLLLPFYVYLIAHYALWIILPSYFQGLGLKKTPEYFINSAFLFGGTNFNWLPLLFLQLSILFPFLLKIVKNRSLFLVYLGVSFAVTFYFTFFHFPYSLYRLVMWIPWSLILALPIYLVFESEKDKKYLITKIRYLIIALVGFLWFAFFYVLNLLKGNSLNFYSHKYPPDFFYLTYGVFTTLVFLFFSRTKLIIESKFKKAYLYISENSYSLFFIHYIVLDASLTIRKDVLFLRNPVIQLFVVILLSLAILFLVRKIQELMPKLLNIHPSS